jgi:hypothetical protein
MYQLNNCISAEKKSLFSVRQNLSTIVNNEGVNENIDNLSLQELEDIITFLSDKINICISEHNNIIISDIDIGATQVGTHRELLESKLYYVGEIQKLNRVLSTIRQRVNTMKIEQIKSEM